MEARPVLERGVYKAPYLVNGFEVLFAVDRHGVARKHVKLTHMVDEVKGTRLLEQFLDRIDPPALKLMRPNPASGPGWPYDHEALPPAPVKLLPIPQRIVIGPMY